MRPIESPTLVPESELEDHIGINDFRYYYQPKEGVDSLLRMQLGRENGIKLATRLLLTQYATLIRWVNIDDVRQPEPWRIDVDVEHYTSVYALGFNDHLGGGASNYKILVNLDDRSTATGEYDPRQYVLHSPPAARNHEVNIELHASGFTVPHMSPYAKSEFPDSFIEPLKTTPPPGRTEMYYYLFGDSTTPSKFRYLWEQIGFSFIDEPYPIEKYFKLDDLAGEPDRNVRNWPGRQFAGQIALIDSVSLK